MPLDGGSTKQQRIRASELPEGLSASGATIDPKEVKTHPTFVDLLAVTEDLLGKMIQDMRAEGFYESEPIVLGRWQGQEEPVLIDGHMRIRAAIEARITQVPFVVVEFPDEMSALQHAMNLQTKRRRTTDGALYRLCDQYDRLMDRGRKSREANELLTRVSNYRGRSASARRTARLIGCNYKKVDKIRKIRRDGSPQIQEDVKNDKISINMAHKLIRDMELGTEKSKEEVSAARVKAAKSVLSEENLAALEELDGNLCSLINLAVEQFVNGRREKGNVEMGKVSSEVRESPNEQ